MQIRTTRANRALLALSVVGLLSAGEAAWAAESAQERMDKQLKRIRDFTGNAVAKLANNVVGRVESGGPDETAPTPALLCCSVNVERINDAVRQLQEMARELDACYAETGNPGATADSALFSADLDLLAGAVRGFAEAPTRQRATTALAGMSRIYQQLLRSAQSLEACPRDASGDPGDAAAPEPAEKAAEKPKKKKKKSQQRSDG